MEKMGIEKINLDGDEIFLKKSFLGWAVIEPLFHPETKKFIWKNFLSLKGFIVLGFILLLLGFSYLAVREQIDNYNIVMSNPCPFCEDCQKYAESMISNLKVVTDSQKLNISFGLE